MPFSKMGWRAADMCSRMRRRFGGGEAAMISASLEGKGGCNFS